MRLQNLMCYSKRLLRFLILRIDGTTEAMRKVLLDIVDELECGTNLVTESYDEAAVMTVQKEVFR